MSLLLAGLTVLMIGDSHMTTEGFLITTLHDDLMQQGAKVYSFGACGTPSGAWTKRIRPPCGSAFRLDDGPVRMRPGAAGSTTPLPQLVKKYHPDLIVVVNGDTMAGYKQAHMPKSWIWEQVSSLTKTIKASGTSCVWVGPAWGTEGGKYGKNFARVKELSSYLSGIVAPCTYIDSLKMSKPGEWSTIPGDGQHFTADGYLSWGDAIAHEIESPEILQTIKH